MLGIRFWRIVSLLAVTAVIGSAAVMASEPTPDEVLKSRGLTRAGQIYVLDAEERGFLEGMAKIQPRYAEMEALYLKLAAIVYGQEQYDALDIEYHLATERLRNVGAEIDDFPSTSNSELKQQYRNLLDLEKQLSFHRNALNRELNLRYKNLVPDWKKEKLFTEFQEKRQNFLTESGSLRAQGEDVKARYGKLSKEEEVKKAIAALRLSRKARVDLGPSVEFKKKSSLLKNAERTISPESLTHKPGSKKGSQKGKLDTPAGTGKRGRGTN
jgi:hypothetical protein